MLVALAFLIAEIAARHQMREPIHDAAAAHRATTAFPPYLSGRLPCLGVGTKSEPPWEKTVHAAQPAYHSRIPSPPEQAP